MSRFVFYGDDFTGSVDSLLQFRRAGLSGVLLTDPAAALEVGDDHAVVGIAGTTRSMGADRLDAEIHGFLDVALAMDPAVIQYKVSSTADSSPEVGSIGRVAELVGARLGGHAPALAVFAQPDFGRYTFFSHHFAADGPDIHRLDRQPTMQRHPVTPMTDSDLRALLAAQTRLPIGAVHWTAYADPAALHRALESGEGIVVADAFVDEHLDALADAVLTGGRRPAFVIGSGGISGALGRRGGAGADAPPLPTEVEAAAGPVLVLSGSRSTLTRAQVEASGWPVVDAFSPTAAAEATALLARGSDVIVSSSATTRDIAAEAVAAALVHVGDACLRSRQAGRVVVSGGDTSGRVLAGLGVRSLEIVAQPWGNTPLLRARGGTALHRMELALKGGQMGHTALFTDIKHGRSVPAQQEEEIG